MCIFQKERLAWLARIIGMIKLTRLVYRIRGSDQDPQFKNWGSKGKRQGKITRK